MPPKHSSDSFGSSPASTPSAPIQLGDNSASSSIVEAARGRQDGFDVGTDRAIPNPPNWDAQPSVALYKGATENNDPATANNTARVWSSHSSELDRASNDLYNAISELGAAWVGEGASSAQGSLVGIANSGSQASLAAKTMSSRLTQQAAAAEQVKKMPPPKPDVAQAQAAQLQAGPAAMVVDQKAVSDAYNDVKAQQVAFLNTYTQAMKEIDNSTPSFGPESLGMKPTATHKSGSYSTIGGISHAGSVGSTSGPGAVFGGTGSFASGAGQQVAHTGVADTGTFSQAGYTGGAGTPGTGALSGAGGVSGAGAPAVPSAPTSGGSGVGQALTAGALGGGLGFAGARALGQGNRSGAREESDTTQASANDGAGQSAASANAPQQGVVSPTGTIGAGQAPPPPGMGGMGGMGGGMGGHGAHAEPDEEHTHASFLIEPDPDDTFGANEATPPPVIGAWADDEDDR